MSNWSDNNSDYKIDTWDPNSVKPPSNAAGIGSPGNSSQHPSYYQTPTAPRYESRSNAPEYNMNDYKRHIDMPSSAQGAYSSPSHHVNTTASQPAFLQQQSNRPQQQQLPEPTFFQKQQGPQHQTPQLELLQQKQLLQQQQSPHVKLLQQRQVLQQQQSPHLELLQKQSQHLKLLQQRQQQQQQQQSPHLELLQQKQLQQQQQQSPHLELLQQKQPQQLARPYSDISNQSSNYQLSQPCATFQSTNNNMSYSTGYMGQTPEPKLDSASNSFDNGSQNYRPDVLSASKCNRFNEPEEIDPKRIFVNPLIDGPEDFQTSKEEELKIQNMKAANERDQEFAYRRPTSIAKASLAQISLDLQKAGEPFRSATSLKNFKNNALGLPPTEDAQLSYQQQNDSLSVALSEVSLSTTSKLSADAKEFTPSYVTKSASLLQRKPAERVMKETLNNLNLCPYLFDDQVPKLQKTLKTYNLNAETVKPLTSLLFEACLLEPNLIHHGSKICDLFSRTDGGFEGFRNGILSLAQKEFSSLDKLLAGGDGPERVSGQERVQNFTKFMSELYLNMKDESSQRFSFLGNKVVDAVEKLQQTHLTDANILAIVQVLKLTVKPLRQQFDLKSEDYKNRLEAIIKKVYSYKEDCQGKTVAVVNSFINFMERKPEAPKPMPQSSASHDHSLSEVVFFTPEGKAYTEQDVIADEMLGICSTITENYKLQLEIEHQQRANAMYNNNCGEQDDYDDEYEKFMQGLNP